MGEQEETSARLTSLAKECHLFITPSLVARPRTTSSHLVQWTQSPFAPEFLVSRQPAHLHTQAESGAYLRDFSRDPRRRPFIHLNRHTPSGQSRYRITQLRTDFGRKVCWTYQPGSHRISHTPSFCGACLNFSREKDSAVPFPPRP